MIVLDTHAVIWWANAQNDLSQSARHLIDSQLDAGEEILVSAISAWEIGTLVLKQRLTLSMDVSSWLATVASIEGVRFVPVDPEIAVKSTELPGEFHKDPADRMIVATARKFAVTLVTADEKIRAYPHVKSFW